MEGDKTIEGWYWCLRKDNHYEGIFHPEIYYLSKNPNPDFCYERTLLFVDARRMIKYEGNIFYGPLIPPKFKKIIKKGPD